MCVLFYPSLVCISAYANVYFKTTIIKQNIQKILIAGVPSIQALLDYLITAPPSVCAPDVFAVLAFFFFGFESTLLARQLHQERTQMDAQ